MSTFCTFFLFAKDSIPYPIHQGIPVGGYTKVVVNMLKSIEVRFGVDYLKHHRAEPVKLAEIVVCTGSIDA